MPVLPDNNTETYLQTLENEYQNLKNLIFKYDEAISALLTGTHQSYKLDTGQSSQSVTRIDLNALQTTRDKLFDQFNTLALRLRKTSGVKQVRMAW
jgi:hypothetical protein